MNFNKTIRKIQTIERRLELGTSKTRKKELQKDRERLIKSLGQFVWVSSPPVGEHKRKITVNGTYNRSIHGNLS